MWAGIDILVNNAGIVGKKRAFSWDGDEDVWRATIDINLVGTYRVTKAVVPQMVQARAGRVINIASISGKQGSPGNSAYSASKHGVIGLTRTLAQEFAMLGLGELTANAVCPGVVDTPTGVRRGRAPRRRLGAHRREPRGRDGEVHPHPVAAAPPPRPARGRGHGVLPRVRPGARHYRAGDQRCGGSVFY